LVDQVPETRRQKEEVASDRSRADIALPILRRQLQ